jgi:hypothetical protein
MRINPMTCLGLLSFVAAAPVRPVVPAPSVDRSTAVVADYVEARTASVFAGACHYNGERVIEGREAVFAMKILAGSWHGVDLTGVTAAGETVCDDNLAESSAPRHTQVVVNPGATDAQAAAVIDLLSVKSAGSLGTVSAAGRAAIDFAHDAGGYRMTAAGFADLTIRPMPDNACCTQPHLVWYQPLVALEHRKVGYTDSADYTAGTLGDPWQRADENSAFYGRVAVTNP